MSLIAHFLSWKKENYIHWHIFLFILCHLWPQAIFASTHFQYGALIKASYSCPAGTHAQKPWTGIWCYFPGWANCLRGSVLSVWLHSDFALLHDAAVVLWDGSNEDLWEAGCLVAVRGGLERGRKERGDGSEAEKGEEWSIRRRRE